MSVPTPESLSGTPGFESIAWSWLAGYVVQYMTLQVRRQVEHGEWVEGEIYDLPAFARVSGSQEVAGGTPVSAVSSDHDTFAMPEMSVSTVIEEI